MRKLFRRLFGRKRDTTDADEGNEDNEMIQLMNDDLSWMFPPPTLVDPVPWDKFWQDHITNGVAGFVHLFCDDSTLVDVMRANGLKTVLCVGNGISMEPHALAWAGFKVTVLDLSPFAMETAQNAEPSEELLANLVGGRSSDEKGTVKFVVGDLCDVTCCPGPYDVIIDRKTLQLYPDEMRTTAMEAVANRLASLGIFFSHCHDGGWRPPAPRTHATRSWFEREGWKIWRDDTRITGRTAWLFTSTG